MWRDVGNNVKNRVDLKKGVLLRKDISSFALPGDVSHQRFEQHRDAVDGAWTSFLRVANRYLHKGYAKTLTVVLKSCCVGHFACPGLV